MLIKKSEWPGVTVIKKGKKTKYKGQIIYENKGEEITSDVYTVMLLGTEASIMVYD